MLPKMGPKANGSSRNGGGHIQMHMDLAASSHQCISEGDGDHSGKWQQMINFIN